MRVVSVFIGVYLSIFSILLYTFDFFGNVYNHVILLFIIYFRRLLLTIFFKLPL